MAYGNIKKSRTRAISIGRTGSGCWSGKKCLPRVKHGNRSDDIRMGFADPQLRISWFNDRLFDEKNTVIRCEPGKNWLWSLPEKIPTQVRMDDDRPILRVLRPNHRSGGSLVSEGLGCRHFVHFDAHRSPPFGPENLTG